MVEKDNKSVVSKSTLDRIKEVKSQETKTPRKVSDTYELYRNAKSFIQGIKIKFENDPQALVKIIERLVKDASEGDTRSAELCIKLFGGFDVQKMDITSDGEPLRGINIVLVEGKNEE